MSQAVAPPPEITSPPGDEPLYEVVNGQRVELPPMGADSVVIGWTLSWHLGAFVKAHALGRVITEMLFRLDPAGTLQRRPDVAFVSYDRWPRGRRLPPTNAWDVIPDLAVEVVSPTNTAGEIAGKVADYFAAGVRRVWVIYPNGPQVYDYESPQSIRVLGPGDALDGGEVLAGFRLAVADLFEDVVGTDD